MKKTILLSAVLGLTLASLDAGAFSVDPRGFVLCTHINASTLSCTSGTFWGVPDSDHMGQSNAILEKAESGELPEWPSSYTERWQPHGISSFTGSVGVNWTCCMMYDQYTEDPITATMEYWDIGRGSWEPATWKGLVADNGNWCFDNGDYVVQGKTDTGGGGDSGPWSYGTYPNDKVARCKGTSVYKPTNTPLRKAYEYWMD